MFVDSVKKCERSVPKTFLFSFKVYAAGRWSACSLAGKVMLVYGGLMALAFLLTFAWSMDDPRTLREVGIWAKPMKFMTATALFAWTTVWAATLASPTVAHRAEFKWIAGLIIATSLFEVAYISYQAALGAGSHYNTSDKAYALLFGLMALAAVGLTASQAWLAWSIGREPRTGPLSVVAVGVITGLALTFVLSTISGFMLGGKQPPSGVGMMVTGWHYRGDFRPAHFLGVHAQQFIPLLGLVAMRALGHRAIQGFFAVTTIYLMAWVALVWHALKA